VRSINIGEMTSKDMERKEVENAESVSDRLHVAGGQTVAEEEGGYALGCMEHRIRKARR
jgi:hypothetical protein